MNDGHNDTSGLITINFPDRVNVRRGPTVANSFVRREDGMRFGTWYVLWNTSEDAIPDPERNFDVGKDPIGLKLIGGRAGDG